MQHSKHLELNLVTLSPHPKHVLDIIEHKRRNYVRYRIGEIEVEPINVAITKL